jgi:riboflavin-specific deaminase-like protein
VLVGAGTIKTDNPLLNVREVKGRNPVRVIVDGKLRIPVKSKVIDAVDPQSTWIFTTKTTNERKVKLLSEKGVKIFTVKSSRQYKLDIKKIIKRLAKHKITSLLVEGGSNIFTQFINPELFDEIIILQAPKILGEGINAFKQELLKGLNLLSVEKLGEDIKLIYGKK